MLSLSSAFLLCKGRLEGEKLAALKIARSMPDIGIERETVMKSLYFLIKEYSI
ncbi:hypothetical protein [Photorhabdus luminescens]|uniref:hypothetical protein n=1 Tax=Photorhabdus luminescens TaxID=29488 RepID=UPI00159EEA6A|nr:hypothetical protein [Photorhabdus luminescens]